MLNVPGQALRR